MMEPTVVIERERLMRLVTVAEEAILWRDAVWAFGSPEREAAVRQSTRAFVKERLEEAVDNLEADDTEIER